MRKNPTPAEKKLWDNYLSTFPHRILRQRPIDHFIVDFFCAALRLVIEVDGEIHNSEPSQSRDDIRSKILHSYGLQVVRVTNAEVMGDFDRACEKIWAIAEEIPLTPLGRGDRKGREGIAGQKEGIKSHNKPIPKKTPSHVPPSQGG